MAETSPDSTGEQVPDEFPVSVLMERDEVQRGPWRFPRWQVTAVIAGEALSGAQRQPVHSDGERERYLWTDFVLRLSKTDTETYWFNLTGGRPSLYVLCRADERGELEPCSVTADHDLATACTEADETVFATPIPPEIFQWMERFVMTYYRPKEYKKRKRQNWVEETGDDRRGKQESGGRSN